LGATVLGEWTTAAALMQKIGLVDTLVDPKELFTNKFVE